MKRRLRCPGCEAPDFEARWTCWSPLGWCEPTQGSVESPQSRHAVMLVNTTPRVNRDRLGLSSLRQVGNIFRNRHYRTPKSGSYRLYPPAGAMGGVGTVRRMGGVRSVTTN